MGHVVGSGGVPSAVTSCTNCGTEGLFSYVHRDGSRVPYVPIVVAGIDDLGSGRVDLAAAVQDRPEACPTILLSHHPEIFPLAARADVELTLAGHWHGGQIRFPIPGGYLSIAHFEHALPGRSVPPGEVASIREPWARHLLPPHPDQYPARDFGAKPVLAPRSQGRCARPFKLSKAQLGQTSHNEIHINATSTDSQPFGRNRRSGLSWNEAGELRRKRFLRVFVKQCFAPIR